MSQIPHRQEHYILLIVLVEFRTPLPDCFHCDDGQNEIWNQIRVQSGVQNESDHDSDGQNDDLPDSK